MRLGAGILWFAQGWDHQGGGLGSEMVGDNAVEVSWPEFSGDSTDQMYLCVEIDQELFGFGQVHPWVRQEQVV